MNLAQLEDAAVVAMQRLDSMIARKFPLATVWHWYRAVAAAKGQNTRRNDDCSNDAALAADAEIADAHAEYIRLIHTFYRARDGVEGVLGAFKNDQMPADLSDGLPHLNRNE